MRSIAVGAKKRRILLSNATVAELRSDVISTCLVPTNRNGDVCGAKFYRGQERDVERHARDCTRRNADAIRDHLDMVHPDIMLPWDPELAAWMKQHKAAILSGRMKL